LSGILFYLALRELAKAVGESDNVPPTGELIEVTAHPKCAGDDKQIFIKLTNIKEEYGKKNGQCLLAAMSRTRR